MKVVQINAVCGFGSTGRICENISCVMSVRNIENYILCSRSNGYPLSIVCANRSYIKRQAFQSRVLGNYGFNSQSATLRMIRTLERIQPDIVHLHNIHGHDCNLDMLFSWFRKNKTKLVWTFHDCWAFTGYCTHFTLTGCSKWQNHCFKCEQRGEYSCLLDRSKVLFEKKKALFGGLNLTIVTPSAWMSDLVAQSFLKDYPLCVINNGIDISAFRPGVNGFRKKYRLEDEKIVLGVAFGWGYKKGLDVFIKLAKRLPTKYRIVLVGTSAAMDQVLPGNILSVHRTHNLEELVEIYSAADVFVNPTREENYPTVNMEALACGTPVLTFQTGGSPEMLDDTCGSVVPCDDVDAMEREILRICTDKPYSAADCLKKAREFDQNERFKEYLRLYERIVSAGN